MLDYVPHDRRGSCHGLCGCFDSNEIGGDIFFDPPFQSNDRYLYVYEQRKVIIVRVE